MIKREELKKGDRVLIVPNSRYTRDTSYYNAQITAVGPKFITVAYMYGDNELGRTVKFDNNEWMCEKDYANNRLFLGTEDEYMATLLAEREEQQQQTPTDEQQHHHQREHHHHPLTKA
jgi:hypothetical protein